MRLVNKSNRVAKVTLNLEPGDEVEVPDRLRAQLDANRVTQLAEIPKPAPPQQQTVTKAAAKKAPPRRSRTDG